MSEEKRRTTLGDRFKRSSAAPPTVQEPQAKDIPLSTQLSGNLRDKHIAQLLQLADHYEATGQLQIGGFQYTIVIQFGLGKPIHAFSPFNTGTEAILELFSWQDGKVTFTEGIQPETPSVEDSSPQILTLGDEYLHNMEVLQRLEITELSFLLRSSLKLPPEEFDKLLLTGAPLNLKLQKEFYGNIYGTLNVRDIKEKMNLSESKWMAIVTNLLYLGLILTPDGRSIEETGLVDPQPKRSNVEADLKNGLAQTVGQTTQSAWVSPSPSQTPSGSWPVTPAQPMPPSTPPSHSSWSSVPPDVLNTSGTWVVQPPNTIPPAANTPSPPSWSSAQAQDTAGGATKPQASAPQSPPSWSSQVPAAGGKVAPPLPPPSPAAKPQAVPPTTQQSQSGTSPTPSGSWPTAKPPAPTAAPPVPPSDSLQSRGGQPASTSPPPFPKPQSSEPDPKSFQLGIPDEAIILDGSLLKAVNKFMLRQETGILSEQAFEYLLQREFARAYRFGTNFTLMPFCITMNATGWPVLPIETLAQITNALDQLRRDVDLFGHFGQRGFAFVLPNVDSNQACGLVDRVDSTLPQMIPDLQHYSPVLHFGIASIPKDTTDLPSLVEQAQAAMFEAAKRNVTRMRYSDVTAQ